MLRFLNTPAGLKHWSLGSVVGVVCACAVLMPQGVMPGHWFDLRAVILAASALVMGPRAILIALLILAVATGVLHAGLTSNDGLVLVISSGGGLLIRYWQHLNLPSPRPRSPSLRGVEGVALWGVGAVLHLVLYGVMHWRDGIAAVSLKPVSFLLVTGLSTALFVLLVRLLQTMQQQHDVQQAREKYVAHLRESEHRLHQLLDELPLISIQGYRPDGTTIYWNKASEQLYGYSAEEALGKNLLELIIPETIREGVRTAVAQMFATGVPIPASELSLRHKDGQQVDVFSSHAFVHLHGKSPELFCLDVDVTEYKAAEEKARFLATHDILTGLPNRRWLMDALPALLESNTRDGAHLALLMLDLDQFKSINDSLGHEAGDQLLIEVANRLQACVRKGDHAVRLSGDEFVIVLLRLSADSMLAATEVQEWGDRVLTCLRQPVPLAGQICHPMASMGAAIAADETDDANTLLKQVELAMYRAKEAGRDTLSFFDPVMQDTVDRRVMLQAEMQLALQQEQFMLHLQPQVNDRGEVIGAEVLVRWQHPEKGVISPGEFIPLAEETGQILALGQWVLAETMRLQARWQGVPQLAKLGLSVNISARQFRKEDFVDELLGLLARTQADPTRIKLELTESLLLQDVDAVIVIMRKLRDIGFGISLDDFGTGYSSMGYLTRLPLDQIKIDQGFVRNMLDNKKDAAIAESIIQLAKKIDLEVIAEGVETEAHYRFLLDHGCREFQGYWFGRPMPLQDFLQRVQVKLPMPT